MSDGSLAEFRIGNVTATIWEKGESRISHTVELSCTYKDGDQWKTGTSLMSGDLLNAAKLLQRAEEWLARR